MIVFTLGMSRPFSMIVVDSRTSYSCATKPIIAFSSSASLDWPWATASRASGTKTLDEICDRHQID